MPLYWVRQVCRLHIGHRLALLANVEHVTVTGLVAPGSDLARAQPRARVGHRVVGIEPLLGGVQQVHAPGVGVALLDALQQRAVGRGGIDAGEHRLVALEYLVVQARANPYRCCARLIISARCAARSTQK